VKNQRSQRKNPRSNQNSQKEQDAEKAFAAGVIVFRNTKEGKKYLIMYHRGSYWNFPKGAIEKGESSMEAAVRELEEETGLKPSDIKIQKGFRTQEEFQFHIGKRKINKTVILYLAQTKKKGIDISRGKHEEGFGWFLYKDANKILSLHKESQNVLRKANNFLKNKSSSYRSKRQGKYSHQKRRSQQGS